MIEEGYINKMAGSLSKLVDEAKEQIEQDEAEALKDIKDLPEGIRVKMHALLKRVKAVKSLDEAMGLQKEMNKMINEIS